MNAQRAGGLDRSGEIEALNDDLVAFDLDAITIEELERRYEMALMSPVKPSLDCNCPNLRQCGTYCVLPPPI